MTGDTIYSPVLWDDKGEPVSVEGSLIAPLALSVANVWQLPGRVFPSRWDEALRDNPQNALAMRRRAFYARLMQERIAPTVNLTWQVKVKDDTDPGQARVRDAVQESWDNIPDKVNLIEWLCEAIWYGRSGSQVVWDRQPGTGRVGVVYHEPVNGDGIQFDWAGHPVILVSQYTARRYQRQWPASVLPPGKIEPSVVNATDRGAWGLKLDHPVLRRRFLIHKHRREAADYFEGEMSGGAHGVGLRSKSYWTDQMLVNSEAGMMNFLFSTGMMDLLVFNYLAGNDEAKKAAQKNAEKITGKVAVLNPVLPADYARLGPVTQIPMSTGGVDALQKVVQEHYGKQLEHLFVGQSMSTGADGAGSLGGSGRAEFAASTKTEILRTDAERLRGTLTRDWAIPARDFLFPGSAVAVTIEPVIKDPDRDGKQLDAALKILPYVAIEVDELRERAGFRKPRAGKETVGGQQAGRPDQPGANGLNPALPPGRDPGGPDDPSDDPGSPNGILPPGNVATGYYAAAGHPVPYKVVDDRGHEHKGKGPGGGQFTGKGTGDGGGAAGSAGGAADGNEKSPGPAGRGDGKAGGAGDKMAARAKRIVGKIRPTKERAFTGRAEGGKIDSRLAGAIGEEILIQHLKGLGYADAATTSEFLGDSHNNLAFDLIHDHHLIEAKTGQANNPDGKWVLKYDGRFTKKQEAKFARMTPEKVVAAKKKINAAKVKAIHARKAAFIARMNKELGYEIGAGMMTVIINPDTRTADIYQFDGLHDRIPFKSEMARAAHVGSVKYG